MSESKEKFLKSLSPIEQQIADYVEPILASRNAELVWIRVSGLKSKPNLTLFIDKASLEELASVSRLVSDALDVANTQHNWFSGNYQLELSSPGLDRPLTKKSHFGHAQNQQIRVKTHTATFKGQLCEVHDLGILIDTHPNLIPWPEIKDANIIYVFPKKKRR